MDTRLDPPPLSVVNQTEASELELLVLKSWFDGKVNRTRRANSRVGVTDEGFQQSRDLYRNQVQP
jgi:hypothetical protein